MVFHVALARHLSSPRCVAVKRVHPANSSSLSFVNSRLQQFELVFRQSARSLQFWKRVLSIWATFKITQIHIAAQHRFRSQNWPRQVWDAQHRKAANVSVSHTPFDITNIHPSLTATNAYVLLPTSDDAQPMS